MNPAALFRVVALVVLAVAMGVSLVFLPVRAWLETLLVQLQELGVWGALIWAGVYVLAAVLLIPGSLLTLGAGFAFGIVTGIAVVSIGSTLGAAAAFLVGRTLARGWIEAKVAGNPKFRAIDQAIGEQGFKMVLFLRLSPVFPFNLLNYALGLTRVSFRDYVLASWIGMLPATLVYVYLGSAVKDLAELLAGKSERSLGEKVLFFTGLAATVLATIFVTRIAKKALARAIPLAGREPRAAAQGVPHG